ncbi:hypothetical protein ACFCXR_37995 [Streptomyces noursei]|uniref:hypothetical protein n=1 Tax=Streptomyces noursei TaxID=1971 RepID=UPI00045EF780|nr:hypothetical protein [Streptomyces noursei]AIA03472.1 hypothetical protein DC74_2972 [Streptomyces noursei]
MTNEEHPTRLDRHLAARYQAFVDDLPLDVEAGLREILETGETLTSDAGHGS